MFTLGWKDTMGLLWSTNKCCGKWKVKVKTKKPVHVKGLIVVKCKLKKEKKKGPENTCSFNHQ